MDNPTTLTDPLGLDPVKWTGNCSPNGYTSGCFWGKGSKSNTLATVSCMSGEYCGGSFGYDVFDALAGERGTYLTVNQRGDIGSGFSIDLWQQEWVLADNPDLLTYVGDQVASGKLDPLKQQAYQNLLACANGGGCTTMGTSDPLQTLYGIMNMKPNGVNTFEVTPQLGAPSAQMPAPGAPAPVSAPKVSIPGESTIFIQGIPGPVFINFPVP